mmetsp:Transcript_29231/g.67093  ORF Transcript_29231/g.67093 Transcript_29231/m.67093 type:complete len:261 (-) Transcript_29231:27-809(-)
MVWMSTWRWAVTTGRTRANTSVLKRKNMPGKRTFVHISSDPFWRNDIERRHRFMLPLGCTFYLFHTHVPFHTAIPKLLRRGRGPQGPSMAGGPRRSLHGRPRLLPSLRPRGAPPPPPPGGRGLGPARGDSSQLLLPVRRTPRPDDGPAALPRGRPGPLVPDLPGTRILRRGGRRRRRHGRRVQDAPHDEPVRGVLRTAEGGGERHRPAEVSGGEASEPRGHPGAGGGAQGGTNDGGEEGKVVSHVQAENEKIETGRHEFS